MPYSNRNIRTNSPISEFTTDKMVMTHQAGGALRPNCPTVSATNSTTRAAVRLPAKANGCVPNLLTADIVLFLLSVFLLRRCAPLLERARAPAPRDCTGKCSKYEVQISS